MNHLNIFYFSKCFAFIILIGMVSKPVHAQRFKASGIIGINLSQIDGDDLYGFSKLGLTAGVKLSYPVKDIMDINLEMLYSQRGSTSGFGFGSDPDIFTDLKYIDLPITFSIKDWYIEDDKYHKVSAHAGISPAYLFAVKSTNG